MSSLEAAGSQLMAVSSGMRNNLLGQREEASKRQKGRKCCGNSTVSECDTFLVELEVRFLASRCWKL